MLRTAQQVAKAKNQECLFGQVLWRQTSTLQLQYPFKRPEGKFPAHGRVYYMRGNQCVFRPYRIPRNPKTPAQVTRRQAWGMALRAWSVQSDAVREAWFKYGKRYFNRRGPEGNIGQNAFVTAQVYRISAGLGVSEAEPVLLPPLRPTGLEQLASGGDTEFRFRLTHPIAEPGMKLLVCITSAMPSTRRRPRTHEMRWIAGEHVGSIVDLPASGAEVTIPNGRFAIAPGQRFGLSVRVINPEGVAGRALEADWIRLPHEAAPGAGGDGTDGKDGKDRADRSRSPERRLEAASAQMVERLWGTRHGIATLSGGEVPLCNGEFRPAAPGLFEFIPLPRISPLGASGHLSRGQTADG